jgi:hypothetical protein
LPSPSGRTRILSRTPDIDIHEGDKVDEAALKDLIRAAVALNLKGQNKGRPKPKPRRASGKRAD